MSQAGRIAIAIVFLGFSAAAGAQTLSQVEVESLLKGKTIAAVDESLGGEGTVTWNADGSIEINLTRRADGTRQIDTGTYRLAQGGYCSVLNRLRTHEKCFKLRKVSATEYHVINPDGTIDARLTVN